MNRSRMDISAEDLLRGGAGTAALQWIPSGVTALYWFSCFVAMTRVLRDKWAPIVIAISLLMSLV